MAQFPAAAFTRIVLIAVYNWTVAHSSEAASIPHPEAVQARWALGGVDPEELVSWALSVLEQGFSGIALQQIAGLSRPSRTDLGALPERAFAELGLKPIDRERAVDVLLARGEPTTCVVMSSVLTEFPDFSGRWRQHIQRWGGNPAGPYNDMARFVHFVVEDLYENGNTGRVRDAFLLMERLGAADDQATRDLIGFGFFETLQNVSSWKSYGSKAFEQFLGPVSELLWREIQRIWAGKASLADVIRAERDNPR